MLGWILLGISAWAAALWGNWFAIGNAVIQFWSLGIMANHGPAGTPIQSEWERFVIAINAVTSLLGLGLLVAVLFR